MINLIEKTIVEPIPNEPEVTDEMKKTACELAVNDLIQKFWNLIADTTSVITTADFELNAEKDEIKKILESIVDDITVDIGMLYKIIDLLNTKTSELLDAGEEKAEEIISDNDPEEITEE